MNKILKVVHISRGFEDYVLALTSTLGNYVEVYQVLAETNEWMESYLPDNIAVIRSGGKKVSSIKNIFSLFSLIKKIKKIYPDIIHIQNGVIWEAFLPFFFRDVPVLVTIHDVTKHPFQKRKFVTPQFLLDYVVRRADALIVHGNQLKIAAERKYTKSNNIFVVPHGVIVRYGEGEASSRKGTNVLFFGTVDKWKGIEYLIRAEPLVKNEIPDVKIKIAGGCKDTAYYKSLVQSGQNIEMILRRQTEVEVRELFNWADIIVLPYIEASQSGVLNLAMNFCIPPIVTDVGALTEVIEEKRNGLVVPRYNTEELAKAICQLLTDEDLRAAIISQLKKDRIGENHGREGIAKKTRDIYYKMVEKSIQ